jgi:hypothetical protein
MQRVYVASGEVHAQQIRSFLAAAGIPSAERGEALRITHGLTVDGLGAVEILVSAEDAAHARDILQSAEAGDFRLGDNDPNDYLT